jgi:hypothetical protein
MSHYTLSTIGPHGFMYGRGPGDEAKRIVHRYTRFMYASNSVSFNQQSLAWRVLTGLHRTVTMSFMVVGHTKFAPDWFFGLFNQKY